MPDAPLALFEGYGVELEYMIVDAASLDVRPIADRLIEAESGAIENEIERGAFAWSNELALHVVELKTNGPAPRLEGLATGFAGELARIDALLAPLDARLLSGAMHPWMDPTREFALWPHGDREFYEAFHRIFDCRGHGWANLQSAHLNLPFADDDEFGRLHAAVRALLPLLPALAAASPFVDARHDGRLDARLEVYRHNARRVPSVTGAVVPEPVFTRAAYEALLESIYRDLAPLDPDATLRHEWVNARGAIARFDRMALEIRVLDVQECPAADLAIAAAVARTLEALCDPAPAHQARLRALDTARLATLLDRTGAEADETLIDDAELLRALGLDAKPQRARDVWQALYARHVEPDPSCAEHRPALDVILGEGPLARRVLARTGTAPSRQALAATYRALADCLRAGRPLRAEVWRPGWLVSCEHGGKRVPAEVRDLFAGRERLLASHRGWDPGALDVARRLARALGAPLVAHTTSRLVVDANRSPQNPAVFSALTRRLSRAERKALLARHHAPHWERVRAAIARSRRPVVHLAVHTFTPALHGVRREFETALLYDPARPGERARAIEWQRRLRAEPAAGRVRRNAPYRGSADGLTTALRRELGARRYLGFEIELNQRTLGLARERAAIAAALARALR